MRLIKNKQLIYCAITLIIVFLTLYIYKTLHTERFTTQATNGELELYEGYDYKVILMNDTDDVYIVDNQNQKIIKNKFAKYVAHNRQYPKDGTTIDTIKLVYNAKGTTDEERYTFEYEKDLYTDWKKKVITHIKENLKNKFDALLEHSTNHSNSNHHHGENKKGRSIPRSSAVLSHPDVKRQNSINNKNNNQQVDEVDFKLEDLSGQDLVQSITDNYYSFMGENSKDLPAFKMLDNDSEIGRITSEIQIYAIIHSIGIGYYSLLDINRNNVTYLPLPTITDFYSDEQFLEIKYNGKYYHIKPAGDYKKEIFNSELNFYHELAYIVNSMPGGIDNFNDIYNNTNNTNLIKLENILNVFTGFYDREAPYEPIEIKNTETIELIKDNGCLSEYNNKETISVNKDEVYNYINNLPLVQDVIGEVPSTKRPIDDELLFRVINLYGINVKIIGNDSTCRYKLNTTSSNSYGSYKEYEYQGFNYDNETNNATLTQLFNGVNLSNTVILTSPTPLKLNTQPDVDNNYIIHVTGMYQQSGYITPEQFTDSYYNNNMYGMFYSTNTNFILNNTRHIIGKGEFEKLQSNIKLTISDSDSMGPEDFFFYRYDKGGADLQKLNLTKNNVNTITNNSNNIIYTDYLYEQYINDIYKSNENNPFVADLNNSYLYAITIQKGEIDIKYIPMTNIDIDNNSVTIYVDPIEITKYIDKTRTTRTERLSYTGYSGTQEPLSKDIYDNIRIYVKNKDNNTRLQEGFYKFSGDYNNYFNILNELRNNSIEKISGRSQGLELLGTAENIVTNYQDQGMGAMNGIPDMSVRDGGLL